MPNVRLFDSPPVLIHSQTGATRMDWVNQPSAITELRGASHHRFIYDFTNVSHVRVAANVPVVGHASAAVGVQWREVGTNAGSWWGIASGGTSAAWCGIGSGAVATGPGIKCGTWYPVNPSARNAGFVHLRFVGARGDGALDPVIGPIQVFVL